MIKRIRDWYQEQCGMKIKKTHYLVVDPERQYLRLRVLTGTGAVHVVHNEKSVWTYLDDGSEVPGWLSAKLENHKQLTFA